MLYLDLKYKLISPCLRLQLAMGLEVHKCNCQVQKASDEGVEDPVHVVCSIASEAAAFKGGPIQMQDSF